MRLSRAQPTYQFQKYPFPFSSYGRKIPFSKGGVMSLSPMLSVFSCFEFPVSSVVLRPEIFINRGLDPYWGREERSTFEAGFSLCLPQAPVSSFTPIFTLSHTQLLPSTRGVNLECIWDGGGWRVRQGLFLSLIQVMKLKEIVRGTSVLFWFVLFLHSELREYIFQ